MPDALPDTLEPSPPAGPGAPTDPPRSGPPRSGAPPEAVGAPPASGRLRRGWPLAIGLVTLLAVGLGAWYASYVQQGVAATFAVQEAYVREARAAFEGIPLLSDDEIALLRRSRNARHVELAQALGVAPPPTQDAADSLARALDLARIQTDSLYTVLPGRYSVPYLTPSGAASLDSIAVRFRRKLSEAGLPPFRFAVSSGWRSAADQAALQGRNVNAAPGTSSHEYATTYDITYNPTRYSPAPDALPPPPRVDPRVPDFMREGVRAAITAQQREDLDGLAADYPSRLTALLGRSLIELEDEGILVTVRERLQPVFHTTVARRLVGSGADGASS